MKLPDGEGGWIEARELVQYDIARDKMLVRHDLLMPEPVACFHPEGGFDASRDVRVMMASLNEARIGAGKAMAEALRKAGKDNSEAFAPPPPHGWSQPTWLVA